MADIFEKAWSTPGNVTVGWPLVGRPHALGSSQVRLRCIRAQRGAGGRWVMWVMSCRLGCVGAWCPMTVRVGPFFVEFNTPAPTG